jgi:nucleoside 2-deoxyribosyltransferase
MNDMVNIPEGYEPLRRDCEQLLADHPDPRKNVFIMTRYKPGDRLLGSIDHELRTVLRRHGLKPLRADDKTYSSDRNLWDNVCIYMICCGLGVAILEDRLRDEFNPNVALEYGFMRALSKPVLLLADKGFRNLRADVVGTLQAQFDITDIEGTLRDPVRQWLRDLDISEAIKLPANATPMQKAAETWRARLEKIRVAGSDKELNDEFWYFGEEVQRLKALFTGGNSTPATLTAVRLAKQVTDQHDMKKVAHLADLLGDIVVSG